MKKLLGILMIVVLVISIAFNASSINLSADFCDETQDPEVCNTQP